MAVPILASDEFTVNALAGDAGSQLSVAGHADGSFLVAWTAAIGAPDPGDDSGFASREILERAFVGATALGGDGIVNTEQRDDQVSPAVAARSDGGYVVVYSSGDEDNLPGTYVGSQVLANNGSKVGAEQLGDYSMYHFSPSVAVTSDDTAVIVSGEEERGEIQLRSADNNMLGVAQYGYNGQPPQVAVTVLPDDSRLLLYTGYASQEVAQEGDGVFGLYALLQPEGSSANAGGTPFLIAAGHVGAPSAQADGGNVIVTWAGSGPDGLDVFAAIISPTGGSVVAPFVVDQAVAGDQVAPSLAVLGNGDFVVTWQDSAGGDGSGAGIEARLFHADGSAASNAFVVNSATEGDEVAPSVAAIGTNRFVVAWQGLQGDEARIFTESSPKSSPIYTRAGTIDLSPAAHQVVAGIAAANSFYVDAAATSGADRITNFGKADVLLTTAALYDGNGDGVITFGRNGVLDIDGPGGTSDTLRIDGLKSGLRAVGERDGLFIYADASVRPKGAIEATLAASPVMGDAAGTKTDVFFYDSALGVSLASTTIDRFGTSDVLVTTTKIKDGNDDGIIDFGTNQRLDIAGSEIAIHSVTGGSVTALEFDGAVQHGGATYYVYSEVGSAAGVSALHFG